MALNLNDVPEYAGRVNAPNADYPGGSFKNEVTPGVSADGTPLEEQWQNDWLGFFQKLLTDAAIVPSGVPDTAVSSDYFDAAVQLFGAAENITRIDIGSWNMDTAVNVTIPHGLNIADIREVQVLIINDAGSDLRDITTAAGPIAGAWRIDATDIILARTTGGLFDSVNYDDGGINRGYITIRTA